MSFITKLGRSEKGRELIEKVRDVANDPKTRAKLDEAREKATEGIGAARAKWDERRSRGSGEAGYPHTTPPVAGRDDDDPPPRAA